MSNNKEYNSVEWLYHKIVIKLCNDFQTIKYAHLFKEQLEQAKAMHEEEIMDAHLEGQCDETEGYPLEIAKKFYKQTFGGNK